MLIDPALAVGTEGLGEHRGNNPLTQVTKVVPQCCEPANFGDRIFAISLTRRPPLAEDDTGGQQAHQQISDLTETMEGAEGKRRPSASSRRHHWLQKHLVNQHQHYRRKDRG